MWRLSNEEAKELITYTLLKAIKNQFPKDNFKSRDWWNILNEEVDFGNGIWLNLFIEADTLEDVEYLAVKRTNENSSIEIYDLVGEEGNILNFISEKEREWFSYQLGFRERRTPEEIGRIRENIKKRLENERIEETLKRHTKYLEKKGIIEQP